MTPLFDRLAARIRAEGPISVADYMAACLTDPDHGYYTTRDPLGAAGDFTTAPEIGQAFGEVLGLWLAVAWRQAGAPARFTLAELGPGRGTLMADALRAAGRVPGFLDAADLVLVEASPRLTARQAAKLSAHRPRWLADWRDLPSDRPLLLLANEFLDALPVDQAVRTADSWVDRHVGLAGDALAFGEGAPVDWTRVPPPARPADRVLSDAARGTVVEIPRAATAAVGGVARRLAHTGGAALFIDYGSLVSGAGDTLQAVADHRPTDPLTAPGAADLTVQVDFARMARAAAVGGAAVWPGLTQATLLSRLGISERTAALAAANPDRAAALEAARDRLIGADAMGTLFKALAITGPGGATDPATASPLHTSPPPTSPPPAFDTPDPGLELDPAWPR